MGKVLGEEQFNLGPVSLSFFPSVLCIILCDFMSANTIAVLYEVSSTALCAYLAMKYSSQTLDCFFFKIQIHMFY